MGDNFRVELLEAVPAKGRRRPHLRLRVVQCHPDANHLRALKNDVSPRRPRFAGRLLADSPVPAFQTPEPWLDSARFPFLAKSQTVTYVEHVSHDLIRLIDRDPISLVRLARIAEWPELDVVAERAIHADAQEPVVRDEPDHYANYLDEAVLEIRLEGDLPAECVPGLSWGSAAFA